MTNLRKLPDYIQLDLFAAEFTDIATRALQDLMWRPFFALGKKPRFEPIIYKTDKVEIMVTGAKPFGIATIYDHDLLMWFISQLVEAKDRGEETSPQMYFTPYDCLRGVYRETGGRQYKLLADALKRLHNTAIHTSIRESDQTPLTPAEKRRLEKGFHWLESFAIRYGQISGREIPQGMTVVLPNWLYQGVMKQGAVLTVDDRYFRLKGGLERVLYLIARKHVGSQQCYSFTMRQLYEKTGSEDRFSNFAIQIRKLVKQDRLPEYCMQRYHGQKGDEVVQFFKRSELDFKDPRYEAERMSKGKRRLSTGTIPEYTNAEHRKFLEQGDA